MHEHYKNAPTEKTMHGKMQISENEYVHSVYVHFLGDVLAHIPTTFGYSFPTFHMRRLRFSMNMFLS